MGDKALGSRWLRGCLVHCCTRTHPIAERVLSCGSSDVVVEMETCTLHVGVRSVLPGAKGICRSVTYDGEELPRVPLWHFVCPDTLVLLSTF